MNANIFFNDPLPNFFCTKLCSILKWASLFFFQELHNMFSDFCAACIVKQNSLLCCPGLAYGRSLVIMAVRLDHGWEIPWTGDTDIGVLKRSWIWMKPLLGWEAGDRHEISITCSIREPGRGRFQGPRSHSWNDGTWSQSWRCKINGPVVASIYSWGFQLCLVQSGGSADDPCWVSIPWVWITRNLLDPARVRCWVLPSTGLGRVVPDPEAWAGRELSVWPWETEGWWQGADVGMWLIVF